MKIYSIFCRKFYSKGQAVFRDKKTGNYWLGGSRLEMLLFSSKAEAYKELSKIKKDSTKDKSFSDNCYVSLAKLVSAFN